MVILDTNHYSEYLRNSAAGVRLRTKLDAIGAAGFLTIVTPEEVLSGWLARIRGKLAPEKLLKAYTDFQEGIESLHEWTLLPWSIDASNIFDDLRRRGVRIGTLDLRIASIALNYDALVLTRNRVDFERVPGLRVENWLD